MSNRNLLEDRKKPRSKQDEVVKAQYAAAVILIAAAAGFLVLALALDRAFDFSRFVY
jgi:hypothetical protein